MIFKKRVKVAEIWVTVKGANGSKRVALGSTDECYFKIHDVVLGTIGTVRYDPLYDDASFRDRNYSTDIWWPFNQWRLVTANSVQYTRNSAMRKILERDFSPRCRTSWVRNRWGTMSYWQQMFFQRHLCFLKLCCWSTCLFFWSATSGKSVSLCAPHGIFLLLPKRKLASIQNEDSGMCVFPVQNYVRSTSAVHRVQEIG
jgi:hypothetical protein